MGSRVKGLEFGVQGFGFTRSLGLGCSGGGARILTVSIDLAA